jgi:hypothetical protein
MRRWETDSTTVPALGNWHFQAKSATSKIDVSDLSVSQLNRGDINLSGWVVRPESSKGVEVHDPSKARPSKNQGVPPSSIPDGQFAPLI